MTQARPDQWTRTRSGWRACRTCHREGGRQRKTKGLELVIEVAGLDQAKADV